MLVRSGLLSVLFVVLAFFFIFACDSDFASDAIEAGTDCNEECPVGAQKISSKNASGSCGADGDYFADVENGGTGGGGGLSASGQCVGEGECQVVCLYPECSENQTLVITKDEFRCEAAEGTSCDGVDCSSHGYCRVINDAAECVCDDGYYAEGLECLSDDGFTCYDYCARDQTCFGTEHFNSEASCLTECWDSFSQEQVNCAEHTNCTLFGDCIEDFVGDDDDDDDDDNDATEMIFISSGSFWMGCEPEDERCPDDESPRHEVYLSSYLIDVFEVTNEKYAEFLNAHGNDCGGNECCDEDNPAIQIQLTSGVWSAIPGYQNFPMVEVSWFGASAFCERAEGRLPSEAEREKAAKGSEASFIYPYGDEWVPNAANWNFSGDPFDNGTTPVGYYDGSNHSKNYQTIDGRSPYGIHDMAGNVWEWVSDWYSEDYYESSPTTNPTGPSTGTQRSLRGGCYYNTSYQLRTTYRGKTDIPGMHVSFGFRCAKD